MRYKLLVTLALTFSSIVLFSQINPKKIQSPCDCIDAIVKKSDRFMKSVEKEDSILVKDNLLKHFYLDFDLIVDFCDQQFEMSESTVEDCKKFEAFESNRKKVNDLESEIEEALNAYRFKEIDIDAMAREFCECKDFKSADDYDAFDECLEAFGEKYNSVDGTEEHEEAFLALVENYCGGVFSEEPDVEVEVEEPDFELTEEMKEQLIYTDIAGLTSSCNCVKEVAKGAEKSIQEYEKGKEHKSDAILNFEKELDIIGEYCEFNFDMDGDLESCPNFEYFAELFEKFMSILSGIKESEEESAE